ncbi:CynX/NimT family MFS transporter [Streptomyces sp. NPDC057638]|uniref:CynX/NimT family MFS transporter n=1 Tax=Streptomyces sp. NPDC057638 TaxID=3346190 RepID=UPI0036A27045
MRRPSDEFELPPAPTVHAVTDRNEAPTGQRGSPVTDRTAAGVPSRASAWLTRLVIVGIVLAAINLRPAITSLGALLEEVSAGLAMSGTVAGLLTSVPPLCFAVFGVAAPRLARRFGLAAVVCAAMVAIAAGLLVRPLTGATPAFLAVSALALVGIAVGNVLMPAIVKRHFPRQVGTVTGLYSMALALGTSVAAAVTVPLTDGPLGGDWRLGLGVWALPAVVAVLPWLLLAREARVPAREARVAARGARAASRTPSATAPLHGSTEETTPRVRRSPTAWALACFFGLQATGAYITMGWMPQIYRDAGVPAGTAGALLAVTMVMGVPLAFVIPRLAARLPHQGPIVVVLGLCGLAGYTGLWLAPAAGAWAWALLLGFSNCAFPLALTMIGMRARTGAGVVGLSAFVQSTGYLIAITGPLLVGALYQHTGGWDAPIALMAGLLLPQIACGVRAGRDRTIEDETGMRD